MHFSEFNGTVSQKFDVLLLVLLDTLEIFKIFFILFSFFNIPGNRFHLEVLNIRGSAVSFYKVLKRLIFCAITA
jgi:hypothetical protein